MSFQSQNATLAKRLPPRLHRHRLHKFFDYAGAVLVCSRIDQPAYQNEGGFAAPLKLPPMKGVPPFKLPSSYEPAAYGGVVLSL